MIWRALVLWSVITVFAYVDKSYGREAAWAASSALSVIALPLSEVERRLGELATAQRKRSAGK